jgi:hypothetical protein
MKKEEKTNVMRVLDGKKVPYISHSYTPDASMSGEEIAQILEGIECRGNTSCPDQLSKAIRAYHD